MGNVSFYLPQLPVPVALLLEPVELQVLSAITFATRGELARAADAKTFLGMTSFVIALVGNSFLQVLLALVLALWRAFPVTPETKSLR